MHASSETILSRKAVHQADLSAYASFLPDGPNRAIFAGPAGTTPYKLIAALCRAMPGAFVDLGTGWGMSALAAIVGGADPVVTYESASEFFYGLPGPIRDRCRSRYGDGIAKIDDWAGLGHLVSLDLDPHDGIQEAALVAALDARLWQGLVLADDIRLNPAMRAWWAGIDPKRKWDLTEIGHVNGSGIVGFGGWTFALTD